MTQSTAVRAELSRTLARSAGALLLTYYDRLEGFETKGAVDLVTAADRASEAYLSKAIVDALPNDGLLGEEGTARDGTSGWRWVLDPLDGTTNFVHGYPQFMVSIGVLRNGRREIGTCYDPLSGELFHAVRGKGATCNERPISVSTTPSLDRALLATGFPYHRREVVDALLEKVRRTILTAHGLRRSGSACWDQCQLARGHVDALFEQGLHPWDLAAASLIVEEAGGRVTNYQGGPFDLFGNDVLLSNGRIHDEVRRRILEDT